MRKQGGLQCLGLSLWKDQVEIDQTVNGLILRGKNGKAGPVEFKDPIIHLNGEVEEATG